MSKSNTLGINVSFSLQLTRCNQTSISYSSFAEKSSNNNEDNARTTQVTGQHYMRIYSKSVVTIKLFTKTKKHIYISEVIFIVLNQSINKDMLHFSSQNLSNFSS